MKTFLIKVGKIAAWTFGVLVVLFIALVIYRIPAVGQKEKAAEAVTRIHAAELTLDTVMGNRLPLPPNEEENNATVAGIDNNGNGIRDDVELAIFAKYPNSAKIRAAELQYALALQLMITEVFDKETWIAAAEMLSRGDACIGLTVPNTDLTTYLKRSKEVEDTVLNISIRKNAEDEAYNFITSYGLPNTDLCDVDLNTLSG
ncbi:MAG TPA: hypothetical protein VHD55_02645 [Candidatus Paceibacterota bacterium]|nr:hypothetical protein [Candidatus Paceibacterota bacterium]